MGYALPVTGISGVFYILLAILLAFISIGVHVVRAILGKQTE